MSLSAFVTGASGFLGEHLVEQLTREGWSVTALVRESSPLDGLRKFQPVLRYGDITDAQSLADAVPEQVDCVFHVAASTNIWSRNNELQSRINIDGTRNVINAAIQAKAGRLVHTSSFIVWGFLDGILTEESEHTPDDTWINYIRTKRVAEQLVSEAVDRQELDAVICNPGHIMGPGDRHNWSRMIRLVHEESLPGIPPGGGAFADVREVARAHIQAFHKGRTGHRYLLGGPDTMFIDVVRMASELLDKPVPKRASPAWLLKAAAKWFVLKAAITGNEPDITPEGAAMITHHIQCSSEKAIRELDYQFNEVENILRDTCDWMRVKGMLG